MAKSLAERMARLAEQKQEALEKAKAADLQLRKLRAEQDRQARINAKKERDRAILQGGRILETAGMLQWDPSTLLGALLEISAQAEQHPEKISHWQSKGTAWVAEHQDAETSRAGSNDSSASTTT